MDRATALPAPRLFVSTDGGVDWLEQPVPSTPAQLRAIACPSTTRCVAVGATAAYEGFILRTVDAGATWTANPLLGRPPALGQLVL